MRQLLCIVVLAWVCGLGVAARGAPPAATGPAKETPLDPGVARALNFVYEGVAWDKTPLSNVLQDIKTKTPANVVVDWRALSEAAVDAKTPITLTAKRVTLGELLDLVSRTGAVPPGLGWHVVGANIVVTTQMVASQSLVVRVYDVADLLDAELALPEGEINRRVTTRGSGAATSGKASPPATTQGKMATTTKAEGESTATGAATRPTTAPATTAGSASRPATRPAATGTGGATGQRPRRVIHRAFPEIDAEVIEIKLMTVVARNVEPDHWLSVGEMGWAGTGGVAGSISCFNGKLVVRTTEQAQRKVAALLEELRGKTGAGR